MEKPKSIKINMLMSVIQTMANFLFPLITFPYVARILMPEGTGQVAFVQAVVSYFAYIADLGITTYARRECAKLRDSREQLSHFVKEMLYLNIITTIVAYVVLGVCIFFIPKFKGYTLLFVVISFTILLQTLGMEWLYQALEKYTYITVRSLIFKAVAVVLTFCLIRDANDVVMYAFINIFAVSASNLLNFFNTRHYVVWNTREKCDIRKHLKPILTFFFASLIITVYGNFDKVMLGIMKNDGIVGLYSAAAKIESLILSVSTAITSVLVPRMAIYFYRGEDKEGKILATKSLRVTLTLMLPIVGFTFLNASDVITLICGEDYILAVPTLRVLLVCVLMLSLTNLFGNQILIPKGHEKRYSQSVFVGLFINLGLNFALIPNLDSQGAAIATLATEAFNVVCMGMGCKSEIKYMRKELYVMKYMKALIVAIVVGVLGSCVCKELTLLMRLSINTIIFFGMYYVILFYFKEPILNEIFNIIKNYMKKGTRHDITERAEK